MLLRCRPAKTEIFFDFAEPKDHIPAYIILHKAYYDFPSLKVIRKKKYAPPGGRIVDVGANIGNHTLYFFKECGVASVCCFEPCKLNRDQLIKNLQINHIPSDAYTVVPFALGARKEMGHIVNSPPDNRGMTTVDYGNGSNSVQITTLDEVCSKSPIDFIKIDVEGFEFEVLQGATQILKNQSPTIMVEIKGKEKYNQISDFLKTFQYQFVEKLNDFIFQKVRKV